MDLNGKTALVTGGYRGIGLAIAQGLRVAGADVVLAGRDAELGQAEAAKLGARFEAVDLAETDSLPASIEDIDILINNAGVLHSGGVLDREAQFHTTLAVMLHAPQRLMAAAVPAMQARGFGRVVNISSGWGSFAEGLQGPGAYGVAKAGLNALTLATAASVRGDDVKINAMCPGWVRTRMGGAAATRSPQEGAETALWLAMLPAHGPNGGFFRDKKPIAW